MAAAAPATVARATRGWHTPAGLLAQHDVSARTMAPHDPRSAEYRFLSEAAADQVLVPHDFNGIGYLDRLAEALQRVEGRRAPRIVRDEDELAALGPAAGHAAWAWRSECQCLQRLGARYDERLAEFPRRLQAGAGRPLSVDVQLDGRTPRKLLQWTVSGAPAAVQLEVRGVGRFPLTARGSFAFGLDYATPIGDVAQVRFLVSAQDGALQRTDWLALPVRGLQSAHWSASTGFR